jgi:hypothetical protein
MKELRPSKSDTATDLLDKIRRLIGRETVDASPLHQLVDALDERLTRGEPTPQQWWKAVE